MTDRLLIRTGYDFIHERTFYLDGVADTNLASASLIEISVKNELKTSELIADVAQTNTGGAVWASGIVMLRLTAVQTATIAAAQNGWIEIAVVIAGIRYCYEDIPVVIEVGFAL